MAHGDGRTPCKNGGGIVRAGEISGRNMSEGAMSYTLGERIPSDLYPLPAKDSLREFLHFIASVKARSHMTIGMTTGLQTYAKYLAAHWLTVYQ